MLSKTLSSSIPLGQKSPYPEEYDKGLLAPIKRNVQRDSLKFKAPYPFFGVDIWNAYEVLYLDPKFKPKRALLSIFIPAHSPFLIESKSLKLYLNSLNTSIFNSLNELIDLIKKDLENASQDNIIIEHNNPEILKIDNDLKDYICIDDLDIEITAFKKERGFIKTLGPKTAQKICSHLFKSHCLVTSQPDFASIFIEYKGPTLCTKGLLRYLVSFYSEKGFSENVIEQIFMDIWEMAKPKELNIIGRFTRRGGLDINPIRSSKPDFKSFNPRIIFQ